MRINSLFQRLVCALLEPADACSGWYSGGMNFVLAWWKINEQCVCVCTVYVWCAVFAVTCANASGMWQFLKRMRHIFNKWKYTPIVFHCQLAIHAAECGRCERAMRAILAGMLAWRCERVMRTELAGTCDCWCGRCERSGHADGARRLWISLYCLVESSLSFSLLSLRKQHINHRKCWENNQY